MTLGFRYLGQGCIAFVLAVSFVVSPTVSGRLVGISPPPSYELTAKEKALIAEINTLRADPPKYAMYLEQSKKYYKGKDYKPPGETQSLTTIEGVTAVDEAINALRATKPLAPYTVSNGMCLAAKDHTKDLGKSGKTGHKGTDGSTTESRVNRYGRFSNGIGENIIYESSSVRELVMGWLVDDGVANRGHRRNLLSSSYRYLGVSVGDRGEFGEMCVLTFAGDFVDVMATPGKGKPAPAGRKM